MSVYLDLIKTRSDYITDTTYFHVIEKYNRSIQGSITNMHNVMEIYIVLIVYSSSTSFVGQYLMTHDKYVLSAEV